MLHCVYRDEEVLDRSAYRGARLRYKKLLNAGFDVELHKFGSTDFGNFQRLKINPFSYTEEEWKFIIYDDVSGKFFINGMDDLTADEMPDYFRPRQHRRLSLEVALERAYSLGM